MIAEQSGRPRLSQKSRRLIHSLQTPARTLGDFADGAASNRVRELP